MTFAFHEHAWLAMSATGGACGDGVQVSCTFDLAEGAWEAYGSQVALHERYKAFSPSLSCLQRKNLNSDQKVI